MSISNVGSILATEYQYANYSRKTETVKGFGNAVEKAAESRQAAKSETSKWAGDMVVPQPPNYSGFTYDSTISNKSKEEMTMDEYKQWFMNEMSKMPVSGWVRSTCVGGALVIKEEAFEKMKSDPEWEKTVMNMIRKMYSVNGIPGSKMIGYQVIGASPEECYGAGIPVKNGTGSLFDSSEKSWWEKRHEGYEELLEEQVKAAQKREQLQKGLAQRAYLNKQLASQQRLQSFFMERAQSENDAMNIAAFQTQGMSEVVTVAYEGAIRSFSESIIGSGKI